MNDEKLISEIAQIKAVLNTLLDFQRAHFEVLAKGDFREKYQSMVDWYVEYYENRLREEVGLPLLQPAQAVEKPEIDWPELLDSTDSDGDDSDFEN